MEKIQPMRTDLLTDPNKTVFLQTVAIALYELKQQLLHAYERAYPDLCKIIQLVLDEEEEKAWELSFFPHLLLPDLVEARIAQLNSRHVKTKHPGVFATPEFNKPVFALCG
jgi:hypothetical protein